jgi:adenylate cyclase
MSIGLSALRDAMEGGSPAIIATSSLDGEPNVSYVSDVYYVDERHLALSWQFFSKTRRNVMENSFARVLVVHAHTAARWRVLVQYLRTETEGPLFERMRARLAGIASEQGMDDVFKLLGSDIYRVVAIEAVCAPSLPPPVRPCRLAALRRLSSVLVAAATPEALIERLLDGLEREFGIRHAQLYLRDPGESHLELLAAHGYDTSPAAAEVPLGEGVIGVAAEVGCPIRIHHALAKQAYARAVRRSAEDQGFRFDRAPGRPGLPRPGSQMAVPMLQGGEVRCLLYVEDAQPGCFDYALEDALSVLLELWAQCAKHFDDWESSLPGAAAPCANTPPATPTRTVSRQRRTDAVFVDGQYVIRGLAGGILWRMLRAWADLGQRQFTSKALRCDASLKLPEVADNLSARLILLQRRLEQLDIGIRLERSGRGVFTLEVDKPLRFDTAESACEPD